MEATEQQRQTTIPDGESLCRGVENDNVLSSRSSDSFDYSSEATTHLCCSGCSNATILPKNFFFCSFLTVPHTFPQIPLAPLLRSLSLSYFSTSWAAVYAPIRSSNKTAHPLLLLLATLLSLKPLFGKGLSHVCLRKKERVWYHTEKGGQLPARISHKGPFFLFCFYL